MQNVGAFKVGIGSFIETQQHEFSRRVQPFHITF